MLKYMYLALIGTTLNHTESNTISSWVGQITSIVLCVGHFSQLHQEDSTGGKYFCQNPLSRVKLGSGHI